MKGSGGPVTPTIGNGVVDNQELALFCTSDIDTVTLADAANLELSGGEWIGGNKSILRLVWDAGASKWTEDSRNEI